MRRDIPYREHTSAVEHSNGDVVSVEPCLQRDQCDDPRTRSNAREGHAISIETTLELPSRARQGSVVIAQFLKHPLRVRATN